jgi:hypothetical protein
LLRRLRQECRRDRDARPRVTGKSARLAETPGHELADEDGSIFSAAAKLLGASGFWSPLLKRLT